jgi:hypothetical protein
MTSIRRLLPQKVLDALVAPLRIGKCSPELRNAIWRASERYVERSRENDSSSARKARRDALKNLKEIESAAEGLSRRLAGCSAENASADELAHLLFVFSEQKLDLLALNELSITLHQLSHAAARALKAVGPDTGGREADIELHVMLATLLALFEQATEKPATVIWDPYREQRKGDFFTFVEPIEAAVARAKGERPRTNAALGKLLQRVTLAARKRKQAASKGPNPRS